MSTSSSTSSSSSSFLVGTSVFCSVSALASYAALKYYWSLSSDNSDEEKSKNDVTTLKLMEKISSLEKHLQESQKEIQKLQKNIGNGGSNSSSSRSKGVKGGKVPTSNAKSGGLGSSSTAVPGHATLTSHKPQNRARSRNLGPDGGHNHNHSHGHGHGNHGNHSKSNSDEDMENIKNPNVFQEYNIIEAFAVNQDNDDDDEDDIQNFDKSNKSNSAPDHDSDDEGESSDGGPLDNDRQDEVQSESFYLSSEDERGRRMLDREIGLLEEEGEEEEFEEDEDEDDLNENEDTIETKSPETEEEEEGNNLTDGDYGENENIDNESDEGVLNSNMAVGISSDTTCNQEGVVFGGGLPPPEIIDNFVDESNAGECCGGGCGGGGSSGNNSSIPGPPNASLSNVDSNTNSTDSGCCGGSSAGNGGGCCNDDNSISKPTSPQAPTQKILVGTSSATSSTNTAAIKNISKRNNPTLYHSPGNAKVWLRTFGCSHNISDSEIMLGLLTQAGYTILSGKGVGESDELEEADCIVVNSCSVKNPSQDAAVNLVRDVAVRRKKPVILTGCVSQADPALVKNLEKTNVSIVGLSYTAKIVEAVESCLMGNKVFFMDFLEDPMKQAPALPDLMLPKVRKNRFVEIIAINTGCLGSCTYCKTKFARGDLRSYPVEQIARRVKMAFGEGVQQVWLTSEDTGAYGLDLPPTILENGKKVKTTIVTLLEALLPLIPQDIENNGRKSGMLRLGMTNPPYMARHAKKIGEILGHPNVFEFLHVPVQSGCDDVLVGGKKEGEFVSEPANNLAKNNSGEGANTNPLLSTSLADKGMNREYTAQVFTRMCETLLKIRPRITLATDIICGFPGEKDSSHEKTLALIKKFRFPIVNISQFYPRPGTMAAGKEFQKRRIPTNVVKKRSSEVTKTFLDYQTNNWLLDPLPLESIKEESQTAGNNTDDTNSVHGEESVSAAVSPSESMSSLQSTCHSLSTVTKQEENNKTNSDSSNTTLISQSDILLDPNTGVSSLKNLPPLRRVWFSDTEINSKKKIQQTIGHTKQHIKIVVPRDDSLLGCCYPVRILEVTKWHAVGEVVKME